MKLRLFSRLQVGATALFYAVVGLLLWLEIDRFPLIQHQDSFWACSFLFAGALSALGWFDESYRVARAGLILAASVAVGFAALLASHVFEGEAQFLIGTTIWLYISVITAHAALQRDPAMLAQLAQEVDELQRKLEDSHAGR